jgi:hypothetical protein
VAVRVETYAFARSVPYMVQRGLATTLTAPIRYGMTGALVAPASGTVTVVRPDSTSLVSAAAVTVASSTATYALSAVASTETLGEGWEVRWVLTFGAEVYETWRHPMILCEYVPRNSVSEADMYVRIPELRHRIPQAQGSSGDSTGWQPQIDAAYYELLNRLRGSGKAIEHLRESSAYQEWLLVRACQLAVGGISYGPETSWAQHAKELAFEMARVEARMTISDDRDDAGVRRAGAGRINLCPVGRPSW